MKIVIYDNGKTINYSSAHNVTVEYGVGIDDLIAAIETGREIVPGVTADYEYTLADARRDARQRRKEMKDGMQKHRDR